jgi:hypothetical protein
VRSRKKHLRVLVWLKENHPEVYAQWDAILFESRRNCHAENNAKFSVEHPRYWRDLRARIRKAHREASPNTRPTPTNPLPEGHR